MFCLIIIDNSYGLSIKKIVKYVFFKKIKLALFHFWNTILKILL